MSGSNVVQLEQDPCSVEAQHQSKTVLIRARKRLTPSEARELAMTLLFAADAAEFGDGHESWFGYDEHDSEELGILRTVIDRELGDLDTDKELDGDYAGLVETAAELIRTGKIRSALRVVRT